MSGLLLTYINCENRTLACAANSPVSPLSLQHGWAEQVKSTVERLHEASISWGDAKAENVLVDVNENAWVIDFGGGYTEGWVEKGSTGLAKISEFFGV